jgi:acyl dehydratase
VSVPSDLRLGDVFSGMELAEVVFGPLKRSDIVRYAGAAGDFNPIHIDDDYARRAGAPTAFAMGMLPAGYLAHAVSDWFGGPQHLRRFRVRFITRVWPGDEIVCRGRVDEVEGDLVTVRFDADRRGPGPSELALPEREPALSGDADVEPTV